MERISRYKYMTDFLITIPKRKYIEIKNIFTGSIIMKYNLETDFD